MMASVRQKRHVQAHEIGLAQQPVGGNEFDAKLALQSLGIRTAS